MSDMLPGNKEGFSAIPDFWLLTLQSSQGQPSALSWMLSELQHLSACCCFTHPASFCLICWRGHASYSSIPSALIFAGCCNNTWHGTGDNGHTLCYKCHAWWSLLQNVVLSDVHHLSVVHPIKTFKTSLPGERRLAPHAPRPGWHARLLLLTLLVQALMAGPAFCSFFDALKAAAPALPAADLPTLQAFSQLAKHFPQRPQQLTEALPHSNGHAAGTLLQMLSYLVSLQCVIPCLACVHCCHPSCRLLL